LSRPPTIARLIAALPPRLMLALGSLVGVLLYLAPGRFRRHTRANLALALPAAGLRRRLAVAAGAGRGALEGVRVLARPPAESKARVREAVGWEGVEAALASGHGVLLISPHLGCFEIVGPWKGDHPLTALYRPNRNAMAQALIRHGRERYARLAPVDRGGVRALLGALKRGEMVLLLPDQVPDAGEGVWDTFFGRPAYTMTLAARLSEVPRVKTFLYCGEMLPRGRGFRLRFLEPDPPLAGDTLARVAAINRNVEKLALQLPEQYLWGYNRYKTPRGVAPP
jgi:KDO2-lipid IV(A) lauroyltransferase